MLKMIHFILHKNLLSFDVLIEGRADECYAMTVDYSSEDLRVVSSDIPEPLKLYECQARVALKNYYGKELPETIIGMWC